MPIGILRLEIRACRGRSRKKFYQDLENVARECNRARNAMLRHWIRWREDNPDWEPGPRHTRDGSVKLNPKGQPVLEHKAISQAEEKAMYYCGQEAAPNVAAKVISHCKTKVVQQLKDNVPYDHAGESRYVWQALLNFERSPASYRGFAIPMPNQDTVLIYAGVCGKTLANSAANQKLQQYGKSKAVVRFTLWSRQSGRSVLSPTVRIEAGDLSAGNRRLLQRIASGDIKMSDSTIVEKAGKWFIHLCYKMPVVDHSLDKTRIAVLVSRVNDRPFALDIEGLTKPWPVGDGRPLLMEWNRLDVKRKTIRYRSRYGHGRGHGKKRFYDRVRPFSRRFLDMQDEFRSHLISDIIKACLKYNCGKVYYREPTKPLRNLLWFAQHGLPFNWTEFCSMLKFKLEQHGIEFEVERMPVKEWKEANDAETPVVKDVIPARV